MIEIVLIVVILLASAIVFWLIKQLNDAKQSAADHMVNNSTIEKELEQYKIKSIQLETELNALKVRFSEERENASEKEKNLKEQLELIGKDLIQRGTSLLRSENEEKLNAVLLPFKDKLLAFEKEVRDNNKKDIEQFANMQAVVKSLSEQHAKMNSTAQNLVDALRGEQKVQGDWGELALERILETSGLEKGREYTTQSSFRDEEGNLMRPDVIIQLPDDKHIIIDSKVSLKAFEGYINADDKTARTQYLANHLLSIKTHIKQLGDKNYSHLIGVSSPDFVLMFIPLESSFALAIKEEPDIYQQAWDKKVVLVTPSTLLATLKTVASIWKQEKQNKNAIEIATQASRLYDKFVGFVSDMEKIGQKQDDAKLAYEGAMNKLVNGNGNLIRSAEKLKELGVKSKKKLDKGYLEENTEE